MLSGVPRSLPGVLEAYQLTRRAAHIGFDWDDLAGIIEKLDEEKREISHRSNRAAAPSSDQRPPSRRPRPFRRTSKKKSATCSSRP